VEQRGYVPEHSLKPHILRSAGSFDLAADVECARVVGVRHGDRSVQSFTRYRSSALELIVSIWRPEATICHGTAGRLQASRAASAGSATTRAVRMYGASAKSARRRRVPAVSAGMLRANAGNQEQAEPDGSENCAQALLAA